MRQSFARAARPIIAAGLGAGMTPPAFAGAGFAELTESQGHYATWLEALPTNLQDSALATALQAICDLDLTELQAIDPPRGFGRD